MNACTLGDSTTRILSGLIAAGTLAQMSDFFEKSDICAGAWPALLDAARLHGVEGLLYHAARVHGALPALPAPVRERLHAAYRRNAVAGSHAWHEIVELLQAFASASVEVLLMKGAALALDLYGDAGLRPFGDADLLIRPDQLEPACRVLQACGYAVDPHYTLMGDPDDLRRSSLWQRLMPELMFVRRAGAHFDVDLHWSLLRPSYLRRRLPDEWFCQHRCELRVGAQPVWTLAPEANLIFLCAHYAKHASPRLIWSYDLALLLARHGQTLDWSSVVEAARGGFDLPLRAALRDVQRTWSVALPPETVAKLSRVSPSPAERLHYRLGTSRSPLLSALWGVASLPGLVTRARALGLYLFPSATYMRARYSLAPDQPLSFHYVRRLLRWLGRAAGFVAPENHAHVL